MIRCSQCGTVVLQSALILFFSLSLPGMLRSAEKPARQITLGLTIPDPLCRRMENRLAREITNLRGYAGFRVNNISGYDNKHLNIRNDELDLIDAGYGVYREALSTGEWTVILHACYHGDNTQMLYSEGLIVTSDPALHTLEEASGRPVYAVSPSSATGWQLQQALFERAGLKIGPTTFVTKHADVPAAVASHPGSIGFCGAFADHVGQGLSILVRTPRVPSALVIVRDSIPRPLQAELARVIKDFFLEEYRADPVFIRRFYVFPLEQDYRKYLTAFETPQPADTVPAMYLLLAGFFAVLSLFLIYMLRRKALDRVFQETGYEPALREIEESGLDHAFRQTTIDVLNHAVLALHCQQHDSVLGTITRDIERLLPALIHRINGLDISDSWKQVLSDRMDTWALIISFNKRVVEHVRSLLAKSRLQADPLRAYTDILAPEELPLAAFAGIDGLLISLYARRNLAVHGHVRYINQAEARHALDSWVLLIQAVISSGLFSQSGFDHQAVG